jgi:hypothetical protein
LGAAAIVSSVFAIYSCQFFSYRTLDGQPWEGFEPPFDKLTSASVGLFSYSELTSDDENILFGDQCIQYEDWSEAGHNSHFYIGQWCSMFAPAAGFLAWVQLFMEIFCCRLRGSFLLVSIFFLIASALQACTFLIFADAEFCFKAESQNQCQLKTGAWYSVGSTAAYLILAILSTSLPSFPGLVGTWGCCIYTQWRRTGSLAKGDAHGIEKPDEDTDEEADWNDSSEQNMRNAGGDASTVKWGVTDYRYDERNLLKSDSSAMMSDVGLNDRKGCNETVLSILSIVTAEKTDTFADDEYSSKKQNSIQHDETVVFSTHSRHPDFLDKMCCGDPLELEKYMPHPVSKTRNSKRSSRSKDSQMATSENERKIDPKLGANEHKIDPKLGAVI